MSSITPYLVSATPILLVIRQILEHPLDARSLAAPVLAVGAAAVMFLHSVPAGGSDLALEAAAVAARAAMGALGGGAPPRSCSCTRPPPAAATSRWRRRPWPPARRWAPSAAWPPGCGWAPTAG